MSVATNKFCREHPDLVALCTNCKHETCEHGKCKQYRALAASIRESEQRQREIVKAKTSGTSNVLLKITAAINVLDDLLADRNCISVYSPAKIQRFRDSLDEARSNAFGKLIDWEDIAKRMDEK